MDAWFEMALRLEDYRGYNVEDFVEVLEVDYDRNELDGCELVFAPFRGCSREYVYAADNWDDFTEEDDRGYVYRGIVLYCSRGKEAMTLREFLEGVSDSGFMDRAMCVYLEDEDEYFAVSEVPEVEDGMIKIYGDKIAGEE